MSKEEKKYYRIIAQTNSITITGQTAKAVTEEEALKDVHLVTGEGKFETRNFVLQPIATQESWDSGYLNFCPRCGARVDDIDDSWVRFECDNCNAEIDCNITVFDAIDEEEDES